MARLRPILVAVGLVAAILASGFVVLVLLGGVEEGALDLRAAAVATALLVGAPWAFGGAAWWRRARARKAVREAATRAGAARAAHIQTERALEAATGRATRTYVGPGPFLDDLPRWTSWRISRQSCGPSGVYSVDYQREEGQRGLALEPTMTCRYCSITVALAPTCGRCGAPARG